MAPPLRRRGSGRYRWVPRLISGFIILSFGLCILMPLVFMGVRMITMKMKINTDRSISCPSCYCDCSFQDFLPITCRFIRYDNASEIDEEMVEEVRKERLRLIKEELELVKSVSEENMRRYKSLMESVAKTSSHYRKEAEIGHIGVATCEQARLMAQQNLLKEKKRTALWQKRAQMLHTP